MSLDLEGGHAVPTDIFPPCSAGLKKLLTEGDDSNSAIRLIAINRTLRVEVEVVYPLLCKATAPAVPEHLFALIVRKGGEYGVSLAYTDQEAVFGVYADTLATLPISAVEDGFRRWAACEMYPKAPERHDVFPRPDELLSLAMRGRLVLDVATNRARKALEHIAKSATIALTPEERRANVEAARETLDALKNRSRQVMPEASKPPSAALSPLARQLLEDGLRNTAPPPSQARNRHDDLDDVF